LLCPRQAQEGVGECLQTFNIVQRLAHSFAIVFRLSWTLQRQLKGGLQHCDGGLQFVRRVGHKFPLRRECPRVCGKHSVHRLGQRRQLGGGARVIRGIELPVLRCDLVRTACQLRQRSKPPAHNPRRCRDRNDEQGKTSQEDLQRN